MRIEVPVFNLKPIGCASSTPDIMTRAGVQRAYQIAKSYSHVVIAFDRNRALAGYSGVGELLHLPNDRREVCFGVCLQGF